MLIEDKFIYISLPRRGSTSFHYSCILNNLDIKTIDDYSDIENSKIDFKNIDELSIMDNIVHGHISLMELQEKFGTTYPIIAVYRDRHETFYSLFKHIIFDLNRVGFTNIAEHFASLSANELFFWNTNDLLSKKSRWEKIAEYLYNKKLLDIKVPIPTKKSMNSYEYVINILDILLSPASVWHNHHKDIIWFDIKNLSEMEVWIKNTINKPFELKHVNSSSYIKCELKLDNDFIKKYNNIYDYYDIQKNKQTFI